LVARSIYTGLPERGRSEGDSFGNWRDLKMLDELRSYLYANRQSVVEYAEAYRNGERISTADDERNAPPELYLPPYYNVETQRGSEEQIIVPSLEKALPQFTSLQWPVVQPYRIILLGEIISLRPDSAANCADGRRRIAPAYRRNIRHADL
jgi:hypothetical protein